MLRAFVDAVDGRAEVLLDGGVRRGTDVLKALAIGARAVAVGRPVLWGLTLAGEAWRPRGARAHRGEVDLAMALSGCATIADVKPDLIFSPALIRLL
jgi:4-hydroxymandelate oxidase